MKEISVTALIRALEKLEKNGDGFVKFKGTLLSEDNSVIITTEKQM